MGMQLIETIEANGASLVTFSGIDQSGIDLVVKISGRSNASANCHFEIFGLPNSWIRLQGDGSSASSTSLSIYSEMSGLVIPGSSTTSNTFSNASIYISNYSGAAHKPYSVDAVGENNGTTAYQSIVAGVLQTTSAITELKIATSASSFASGSTISIYQITAD